MSGNTGNMAAVIANTRRVRLSKQGMATPNPKIPIGGNLVI